MLFEIEKPRRVRRFSYLKKKYFNTEDIILQQPREQVLYMYFSSTTVTKKS